MRTAEIRSRYLEFFEEKGHRVVPSGPLVPPNDPSIMFTVAGMVQFKGALIGIEDLGYTRAASSQRCVRVGGKHNDLENVGFTARHNTFFEMLGNFSFGDYFKEETITWAWEFFTQVLGLDKQDLWITVHPTDEEARKIWIDKIGVVSDRVIDVEDNFWAMGDTGPCGPDSEIFFDQGSSVPGGPPGSADEEGDRFLEVWNLVFPQFDRQPDGKLAPLARPGVDTGAGLERLAAVMQGVRSNYEIDVFEPILKETGRIAGITDPQRYLHEPSFRVVADHVRSCAFLIAEGIFPDRDGRGYVLRRLLRRAIRHGKLLGMDEPFFAKLVEPLIESMGEYSPILTENRGLIEATLQAEEERFLDTLNTGLELLDSEISSLKNDTLPGDVVFKLYDTHGFPVDLTATIAAERSLKLDMTRFDELMNEQRERARGSEAFNVSHDVNIRVDGEVVFEGYSSTNSSAKVVKLFESSAESSVEAETLTEGGQGILVLDRTGFYGEAGGQVGDTGKIHTKSGIFEVSDTTRRLSQFLHHGTVVQGEITIDQDATYDVDLERRQDVARNHTATHLLHAALRRTLGDRVQQKGSLVAPDHLRFDFSHDKPVTSEELTSIELLVNEQITANADVSTQVLGFDEAMNQGAIALFGEKYGDRVRVLTIGNGFSIELCGGTHTPTTGEIGLFKIVSEASIASGVRRVEAITGREAVRWVNTNEQILKELGELLRAGRRDLLSKTNSLLEERVTLAKKIEALSASSVKEAGQSLVDQAASIAGVDVVCAEVTGDRDAMMSTLDDLRERLDSCVVVLGSRAGGSVQLVCGVSQDTTNRVRAGDVIKWLAPLVGARGGGRPEMAQAGGGDQLDALPKALESAREHIAELLTG